MNAASRYRDSLAADRPLTNVYEDLRRRNARRSDLARARAMQIRIERAVQAARQRWPPSRG
jgi:hypothetical protein